jgi:hypothetical protein
VRSYRPLGVSVALLIGCITVVTVMRLAADTAPPATPEPAQLTTLGAGTVPSPHPVSTPSTSSARSRELASTHLPEPTAHIPQKLSDPPASDGEVPANAAVSQQTPDDPTDDALAPATTVGEPDAQRHDRDDRRDTAIPDPDNRPGPAEARTPGDDWPRQGTANSACNGDHDSRTTCGHRPSR